MQSANPSPYERCAARAAWPRIQLCGMSAARRVSSARKPPAAFATTLRGVASRHAPAAFAATCPMQAEESCIGVLFCHTLVCRAQSGRSLRSRENSDRIPSPLAGRRSSRAAAARLEIMGGVDRAGNRARGDEHRLGRMALRSGRDSPVWRGLALARPAQHPVPGILQPDDDALHGLLGRADHRRRLAHLARAGRLGRVLRRARYRLDLALQRLERGRPPGRRRPGPPATNRWPIRRWSRPSASPFSCWRSCRWSSAGPSIACSSGS